MKANTKLINALRKVADDIESKSVRYKWTVPESCNCGLLARELMRADGIAYEGQCRLPSSWTAVSRYENKTCSQTGMYEHDIFRILASYGVELSDIPTIEYLGELSKTAVPGWLAFVDGWVKNHLFNQEPGAVQFFRELADKLQAELDAEAAAPAPVVVPTKVLEVPERIIPEVSFGGNDLESVAVPIKTSVPSRT